MVNSDTCLICFDNCQMAALRSPNVEMTLVAIIDLHMSGYIRICVRSRAISRYCTGCGFVQSCTSTGYQFHYNTSPNRWHCGQYIINYNALAAVCSSAVYKYSTCGTFELPTQSGTYHYKPSLPSCSHSSSKLNTILINEHHI